jgi:hypothetical protein
VHQFLKVEGGQDTKETMLEYFLIRYNFSNMSFNFSSNSFSELLKPEGDLIPVTSDNRIEYIHLVADYKLNRQIRNQCNAFRCGLFHAVSSSFHRSQETFQHFNVSLTVSLVDSIWSCDKAFC